MSVFHNLEPYHRESYSKLWFWSINHFNFNLHEKIKSQQLNICQKSNFFKFLFYFYAYYRCFHNKIKKKKKYNWESTEWIQRASDREKTQSVLVKQVLFDVFFGWFTILYYTILVCNAFVLFHSAAFCMYLFDVIFSSSFIHSFISISFACIYYIHTTTLYKFTLNDKQKSFAVNKI